MGRVVQGFDRSTSSSVSSVCWQTEAAIGVIRGIGFLRKHPLGEHSTQSGANVRSGRIRDVLCDRRNFKGGSNLTYLK
jgi:hypothetical protein